MKTMDAASIDPILYRDMAECYKKVNNFDKMFETAEKAHYFG